MTELFDKDETFTREQIEAHVNKRLEEFVIAQQSVSASKDELIRELVRALQRKDIRAALTLAYEAGYGGRDE